MGRNVEKRKSLKKGVMGPENQEAFKPMMDSDARSKKDSRDKRRGMKEGGRGKRRRRKNKEKERNHVRVIVRWRGSSSGQGERK